jgi:hypothetical protein
MSYKYKCKKYINKLNDLNGGFIDLDLINLNLAPKDKKEKLLKDIEKKKNEIKLKISKVEEINQQIYNNNINKSDIGNYEEQISSKKILDELKKINENLSKSNNLDNIINTENFKNKMGDEIDNIAKEIKDDTISIDKGKQKTIDLLEDMIEDVKIKTNKILENSIKNAPSQTTVNCTNGNLPIGNNVPQYMPQMKPYYYKRNIPIRVNPNLYHRYNLRNNKFQKYIPLIINPKYKNIESKEKNEEIKSDKLVEQKKLEEQKKLDTSVKEIKKVKKFDFSKIYGNTYLFAIVLILANFI